MLPLIEKEIVVKRGWAKKSEILDVFALAQSVPGAIGVNTAVFIGSRLYGIPGAVVALLGVVIPSILIILIIAQFFVQFQTNMFVANAFSGVRSAVIGLLAVAAVRVAKDAIMDCFGLVIAAAAFLLAVFKVIPVIWIMILGAAAGLYYYHYKGRAWWN